MQDSESASLTHSWSIWPSSHYLVLTLIFWQSLYFLPAVSAQQAQEKQAAKEKKDSQEEQNDTLKENSFKIESKTIAPESAAPQNREINPNINLAISAQRLENILRDLDNPDPMQQDKAAKMLKEIAGQLSKLADKEKQSREALLARHLELTAYNALAQRSRRDRSNAETTYNVRQLRGAAKKTNQLSFLDAKRLSLFWTLQADLFDLNEAAPPRREALEKSIALFQKTLKALESLPGSPAPTEVALTQSMEKHLRITLIRLLDEMGKQDKLKLQLAMIDEKSIQNPADRAFITEAKHYQSLRNKKLVLDLNLDQGQRYRNRSDYGFRRNQDAVEITQARKGSFVHSEARNQNQKQASSKTDAYENGNVTSKAKTLLYFLSESDSKAKEVLEKLERMKRKLAIKGIKLIPIYAEARPKEQRKQQTQAQNTRGYAGYWEQSSTMKLTQLLGIQSLPRFVVLDSNGRIIQISGSPEGINALDQ